MGPGELVECGKCSRPVDRRSSAVHQERSSERVGAGAALIGIDHQGFVDAWAPLFFFALLFRLSMDYQLFLLAAIRERYEANGDTKLAIRELVSRAPAAPLPTRRS